MKTISVKDAQSQPNPHGVDARKLYDTEYAQVMHLTLKPGEQLKRHKTPVDVFFYVLEGKGTVQIGEEQLEAGPDTLIDSPARIPHCWYNRGSETLRILVVKVPRPTEPTQVL
jgi:mannose-6-phosphate isomerase-like protein (cupin superfamily)